MKKITRTFKNFNFVNSILILDTKSVCADLLQWYIAGG